jgi:hypothetical protein
MKPIPSIVFLVSRLCKNETYIEHSSFFVSSSLKNETDPPLIESILFLDLINVELSLPLDLVTKPSFHALCQKSHLSVVVYPFFGLVRLTTKNVYSSQS